MVEPFLFQYKEICQSPNRVPPDDTYFYSEESDMVIDKLSSPPIPAIESLRSPGPGTKKKDIEKGEDMKDSRMWR